MRMWTGRAGSRCGAWVGVMMVGAMLGSSGCSIIFDTESYREEPGQGPVPSTPTVSITPEDPTSLVDLHGVIAAESTDPLGETVTYRYEWLRGTTVTAVTTDTVPASETAKGEVWTLRVTPVAGTPERAGLPGTDTVTIGNLPPSLGYARLSRYEVWDDESITASAGDATDPDGDVLTTSYEWTVNGGATTVTSSTFDVDASIEPGDVVSVTIRVSDGDATSDPRSAGGAIVRTSEGWRQLEPNRAFNIARPLFFADPERGRMLFLREGALWEYRVSGSRAVPWAKLNLTNLPELFGCSVIYDAAESRFLIWGGMDFSADPLVANETLYELSIPGPGLETWREVPTVETPPPRLAHVTLNDVERGRGIILGGGAPGATPVEFSTVYDDLWELDYTTADPTFTLLDDSADTPAAVLMGSATDDSSGVAYLFGGFSAAGTGLDGIFAYDFAENAITSVGQLSSPRGGVAAVDMGDGTALLVDGGSALIGMTFSPLVERFTYASPQSTVEVTLTGTRPTQVPSAELVRVGGAVRWYTGHFANDLFVYDLVGLDVQPQLAPNLNVPGSTVLGNVIRGTGAGLGLTFAFGLIRRNFDRTVGDTTYNFDGAVWQAVPALSSVTFGRWGASTVVEGARQARRLFGGSLERNFMPNASLIDSSSSSEWEEARVDEAALHPHIMNDYPRPAWECNNHVRVRTLNDTYVLDGPSPAVTLTAGTGAPTGLVAAGYEALAPAGGSERVVVFGGSSSSEWFTALLCATIDDWEVQTPAAGPVGRFAPAMTKIIASLSAVNTSQILLFGGADSLSNSRGFLGDFWLITMDSAGVLTAQQLEHTSHPSPPPRSAAMLGWDGFRRRAILFGGEGELGREFPNNSPGTVRADTWEYRLPEGI
jgi:hypothetical protein